MELENKIITVLKDMDLDQIVPIWNQYCEAENYYDDRIENMADFNELMAGTEPLKIVRMCTYGDIHWNHDYFCFNGYGNPVSFDWPQHMNSPICFTSLAEYAVEHDEDFDCDEIRELLDEAGTEEE